MYSMIFPIRTPPYRFSVSIDVPFPALTDQIQPSVHAFHQFFPIYSPKNTLKRACIGYPVRQFHECFEPTLPDLSQFFHCFIFIFPAYDRAESDHQDINQIMPEIALLPPWIVNLPQKIGHFGNVGLCYFDAFFPSQRRHRSISWNSKCFCPGVGQQFSF
jgi:hypothetical protein